MGNGLSSRFVSPLASSATFEFWSATVETEKMGPSVFFPLQMKFSVRGFVFFALLSQPRCLNTRSNSSFLISKM